MPGTGALGMFVQEIAPVSPLDFIELHANVQVLASVIDLLFPFFNRHFGVVNVIRGAEGSAHWTAN